VIAGVADTHTVIWYLAPDVRLSANARAFIDSAFSAGIQIAIASISLVEMVYLIERSRIPAESLSRLVRELQSVRPSFIEVPLEVNVTRALSQVDASQIPDMPDRIIAATALYLRVPLISRDSKITLSSISTVW
jgi:PIN domain nuclease of toxin-antitoxin system